MMLTEYLEFPDFCARFLKHDWSGEVQPLILNDFQKSLTGSGIYVAHRRVGKTTGLLARMLYTSVYSANAHVYVVRSNNHAEFVQEKFLNILRCSDINVAKNIRGRVKLESGEDFHFITENTTGKGLSGNLYLDDVTYPLKDNTLLFWKLCPWSSIVTQKIAVGGRAARSLAESTTTADVPPTVYDIVNSTCMDEESKRRFFHEVSYDAWINEWQV